MAADAQRDKDAETIWCAEFEQLRALVVGSGDEITLERASLPGETIVKVVRFDEELQTAQAQRRRD